MVIHATTSQGGRSSSGDSNDGERDIMGAATQATMHTTVLQTCETTEALCVVHGVYDVGGKGQ